MAKPTPQATLPGLAKKYLPKEEPPKKQQPRSLAGLTAFFLRCFPDQGKYNFAQTRWALQKVMAKNGLTVDDMFLRINRMNGKHPTMTPWEVGTCELPERARRHDKDAPEDVTAEDTDMSSVPDNTREEVLRILRRNDTPWEEEQL